MEIQKLQEQIKAQVFGPGGEFELGQISWECAGRKVQGLGFVSPPETLAEVYDNSFAEHANNEFLVYKDERLTFKYVQNDAEIEQMLYAKFGVGFQDRILLSSRNYTEWPTTFIASTAYGASIVPLNSLLQTDDIAYAIKDSQPRLIVVDEEQLKKILPIMELVKEHKVKILLFRITSKYASLVDNKSIFSLEAEKKKVQSLPSSEKEKLKAQVTAFKNKLEPRHMCAIFYTSGTTGFPKGVMLSHQGICNQLFLVKAIAYIKEKVLEGAGLPKPGQQAIVCAVPLFHVTGCHHNFLTALVNGARLVTMYKWDATEALRLIETEKPSSWSGVPTMIQDLMEHPDFDKTDTSSLQSAGGGGAPTPAAQVTKVQKKFANATASNGYGLSEVNGAISWNMGEDLIAKPTSCGRAFPHVEICLANPDQPGPVVQELPNPDGETVGELLMKTPLSFIGYWNKKEKTDESLIKVEGRGFGWFRSGDIARVDKEGFIFILDRAKDLIIRGGENISCAEVESAVFLHQDVMEAAVFGVKDDRLGEEVGLAVVTKRGIVLDEATQKRLKQEVIKTCMTKIAKFKVPLAKHIFLQSFEHPLPRGATGKTLKREIRQHYNEVISQRDRKSVV